MKMEKVLKECKDQDRVFCEFRFYREGGPLCRAKYPCELKAGEDELVYVVRGVDNGTFHGFFRQLWRAEKKRISLWRQGEKRAEITRELLSSINFDEELMAVAVAVTV